VDEGKEFLEGKVKYYINYNFDCDSAGVIYLIDVENVGKSMWGVQLLVLGNVLTTRTKVA
jgi:hypothetical protein